MSTGAEAFHGELDYLWRTVGEAQDSEARSELERAAAREGLERATARIARLERELAQAAERERQLKTGTEKLKTALEENAKALAAVSSRARAREDGETAIPAGDSRVSALELETARLRSEAAGLREALKGRADTIELLNSKVAAIMTLPHLAAALAAETAVSGKSPALYEHLVARLEKDRLDSGKASLELQRAASEAASARDAAAAAEQKNARAQGELAAAMTELAALRAGIQEAEKRAAITADERAALDGRALALKAALEEKETALAGARAEADTLRRDLDAAAAEAIWLRGDVAAQAARTEEQRANFSQATQQVFRLQERAAALGLELSAALEKNRALSSELEARTADIEKVNGLLRDAKVWLGQEKEVSRRAAVKLKSLEGEIEALKAKADEANEYSGRLLRTIEERGLRISSLKEELKKIPELELENEDLRRKNIRFSGLLLREQADFTAKAAGGLEKAAKGLKSFSLRIPAAERKALEPAIKNVLASINLLKAWREYLDPELPELAETELSGFFSGEVGKWERAFKQRKLSITAVIAAPRLRARIDAERMKMLVYHLVKNAYENLQQGGSLRVTLKAAEDGRSALISFEDSGPGFTKETLDKLFAPFNTSSKDKAGIGLAVAHRIAEKHGGNLEASSRKERGALVELRLPL